MYTAGQATFFRQQISTVGEVARFGALMFTLYAAVQLVLVLFFAPLFAASRIAQEKDRQTLILLLMTDLYDREMVVGKLLASLLPVGVLIGISAPVLALLSMLGGVSASQIGWSLALSGRRRSPPEVGAIWWLSGARRRFKRSRSACWVCCSSWRLSRVVGGAAPVAQDWVRCLDPFRGLALIVDPLGSRPHALTGDVPAWPYVGAMLLLGVVLNVVAIARLRVWNPPRNVFEATKPMAEGVATRAASRAPWYNPVLWREICTRAYGSPGVRDQARLSGAVRVGRGGGVERARGGYDLDHGDDRPRRGGVRALGFVSLLFVNAQAVTSITTERDARTLELLLVTDVTSREFVFGKLLGG